jgi:tetratricopeptide (TPR) repeat protein
LALVTLALYSPCLSLLFINLDDPGYVTECREVAAGLTPAGLRWAFTTFRCGHWHPLTWLSLQLDRELYGGVGPRGFHLTNVLLHTASTLLLYLFLCKTTGSPWRSGVACALFAWHPLRVDSVAWVSERKGVLSTFFWMLTLIAYLYYVRRPGVGRYLLVALALVLGLMAKPVALTLPFVLLLLDVWPLRRWQSAPSRRTLLLEKVPLIVLVIAFSVVAALAQGHAEAVGSLDQYPLGTRLLHVLRAYVAYIGLLLWPVNLTIYYPYHGESIFVMSALAAGLFLAAVTALVLGPGRRRPYLAVGWLWFLGVLVPMIGLLQLGDQALADRYSYVPLIGLSLLLTWGVADLALALRLPPAALAAFTAVALGACLALTWRQIGFWKSDKDLWEHALAVTTDNAVAHNNLGMQYYRQGQLLRAGPEFEKAVANAPRRPLYRDNYGTLLKDFGRLDEALAEYRQAIALAPDVAVYRLHLANLLKDLGRSAEAEAEYREAVALEPGLPLIHHNLATLLKDLGRLDEASEEYHKAIALDPEYESPWLGLGSVLGEQGRHAEAADAFRRALALNPRNGIAHLNLGMALQAEGRLDEALTAYRRAMDLGYGAASPLMQSCLSQRALRPRLAGLVAGRDKPSDNAERLAFADLCGQPFEARYALAARLYADAFLADPALTEDLRAARRTDAARVGARAGSGQGRDASELSNEEKARLRRLALGWLKGELSLWEQTAKEQPRARDAMRQILRLWQRDGSFAAVRDKAALARLPEAERAGWRQLWQEVEAALASASAGRGQGR